MGINGYRWIAYQCDPLLKLDHSPHYHHYRALALGISLEITPRHVTAWSFHPRILRATLVTPESRHHQSWSEGRN